jgi:pectate lyase
LQPSFAFKPIDLNVTMRAHIIAVVATGWLAAAAPLGESAPFDIGLAAWGLEGYAKDNPVGPTTGGQGGSEVSVSTPDELFAAVADNEPRIVYVKGKLTLPKVARIGSNKSIIGKGWNAEITQHGLLVTNQSNVIIRNLKISFTENGDNLALNNATRVWIDHNEFQSEFGLDIGPDFYVRCLA